MSQSDHTLYPGPVQKGLGYAPRASSARTQLAVILNMALCAGANVRACELEAPCLNPVEVAIADLFHFEAYIKGPPLGPQDVAYKDPNATVLGTRAAAFLFLDGSAVFVLRARGSRDIPSTLGFWEGMEGPLTPWQRTPQAGIRRYQYQCSFCKLPLPMCL